MFVGEKKNRLMADFGWPPLRAAAVLLALAVPALAFSPGTAVALRPGSTPRVLLGPDCRRPLRLHRPTAAPSGERAPALGANAELADGTDAALRPASRQGAAHREGPGVCAARGRRAVLGAASCRYGCRANRAARIFGPQNLNLCVGQRALLRARAKALRARPPRAGAGASWREPTLSKASAHTLALRALLGVSLLMAAPMKAVQAADEVCTRVCIVWRGACITSTPGRAPMTHARMQYTQEEEDEEEEEVAEKMLPSSVAIGLKGFVVAGTMYALVDLFTGPKIEQEVRRGDEAEGERVCARARHTACFLRSVHVRDIHIQVVATALFFFAVPLCAHVQMRADRRT